MITLECVSVVYPNKLTALADVSLTIERGEFVFIVGATGAGKSTLLKIITRETTPTTGKAIVMNRNTSNLTPYQVAMLRREMGIAPQDFALLPNKKVWENVEYALRVIGVPRREARRRVLDALERVGLSRKAGAYPYELSGGEAQRVALARAIANNPSLIIADEPTGNLDPEMSMGIMDILLNINARGAAVIVATHDCMAVDRLRKRVIEMAKGIIVRDERESSYVCGA